MWYRYFIVHKNSEKYQKKKIWKSWQGGMKPIISRNRPDKRHLQGIKSSLNMYGKLQGVTERIIAIAPPHGKFLKVVFLCWCTMHIVHILNFQICFLFDTFKFPSLYKIHWWYFVIYFVAFNQTSFFLQLSVLHCPRNISLKGWLK